MGLKRTTTSILLVGLGVTTELAAPKHGSRENYYIYDSSKSDIREGDGSPVHAVIRRPSPDPLVGAAVRIT